MSRLNTKLSFIEHLESNLPTGVRLDDVAKPNQKPAFEPDGKEIWLEVFAKEATSTTTGKSSTDSDERRGFFQISVRVPLSSYYNDNQILSTIDELASTFKFGTDLLYNGQEVSLLDNNVLDPSEDGAWYRGAITINYLTISNRI